MPRDGSTIYHKPFPDVIHNTTIESTVYNGFVNDIEGDMNNPRPILSGGTGANNARDAMLNLKGEIALQSVTNFDSHPWVNGSFFSAAGATAAPNAVNAFAGDYFQNLTGDHATIHARATTGTPFGALYIRQKVSGVWGAWFDSNKPMDDKKVDRAGDVMTGDLFIDKANPSVVLDKVPSGTAMVLGQSNATARWRIDLGDSLPEGGTQTGSNFTIHRFNNAGAFISTPLTIARETGNVTIPGTLSIGGTIVTSGTATFSGPLSATYVTTSGLTVNGVATINSSLNVTGEVVLAGGDTWLRRVSNAGHGLLHFGNSGVRYIYYDGSYYNFVGAPIRSPGSHSDAYMNCSTSASIGTSLSVGTSIYAAGAISSPAHCTFGNLTAQGGVVYLNAANSDYIQASGFNLNYRGQTIYHTGNLPAPVYGGRWVHAGDIDTGWYVGEIAQMDATAVSGIQISYHAVYIIRFRHKQYFTPSGWLTAGWAS
jgi:hypothetical protein